VQTYNDLEPDLGSLSNALVELENVTPSPSAGWGSPSMETPPLSPSQLVFSVPRNERLMSYWDTVADRLFKIRHCMNIEGVERQLPLFAAPIDPGLLVKAAAAGIDIGSALNDITAPLPQYRFRVMVAEATGLCAEVRALGNAMLAALEKRDAETLALLRSGNELKVLNAVTAVRKKQVEEAEAALEAARRSRKVVEERHQYYKSIAFMNPWETVQLILKGRSLALQGLEALALALGGVVHLLPNVKVGAPTSVGATHGGDNAGKSEESHGLSIGTYAAIEDHAATVAGVLGSHHRRKDEWELQERLSEKELQQLDKQIVSAEIRLAIAKNEQANHDMQMTNAKKVDEFLNEKFTSRELYDWMVGQISSIYFQSYQLAYDVAKGAEQAYRHELGLQDSGFIEFGYWDSLKKGLLAGDRLHHDLKRLEVAYLDQNKREYELTKHVSLALLDPAALLEFKETGKCFVNLREALFDLDNPGHYMRRIKSVGVSIPCVTGPYTSVSCKLTLLKSTVRVSNTLLNGKHGRDSSNGDIRFVDRFGAIQSIVTSGAQSDSGLFATDLNDERYLPFEGAGVISDWQLTLPTAFKQFDHDTISDVILQIRYTAREGGDTLRDTAVAELQAAVNQLLLSEGRHGLFRAVSARHELPTEWHQFLHPASESADRHSLAVDLGPDRFPLEFHDHSIKIKQIELFLKLKEGKDIPLKLFVTSPSVSESSATLASDANMMNGLAYAKIAITGNPGVWTIEAREGDIAALPAALRQSVVHSGATHPRLNADVIDDLIMLVTYQIGPKG
jgi:hypothetical protein